MKVVVTGANGYLGQNIMGELQRQGATIKPLKRHLLYGDPKQLANHLAGHDVVINLAGAPILKRWTSKNKTIIYNSRVLTTKHLCEAIQLLPDSQQPKTFLSASAVGIYRNNMNHDETSSKFANHFATRVIDDWEDALVGLPDTTRLVIFRIGIVLGKQSQFMSRLLPVFKLGLGGQIANGQQALPFIHIQDLTKAFVEAASNESYFGIYNLVAPEQISNKSFTQVLAKKLKRPAVFKVPAFLLKLLFGKASTLILNNPVVLPSRLKAQNFNYQYPTLDSCLDEILNT
ncbi:TIGR01777 family oxidoreductase [uncultured Sunxiuqinia sp.]|uniref:TIGR01777 family oxidoreductase n=1 Tax=uncultured Sunxiuqinia sp. TaxID=1573825 RepID=UPI00260DFAB6|nr:TIGR01777 family oxidoreductase [uncultured Sunxiuqinia sp.]